MDVDKENLLAWILLGVIICWFCLEFGGLQEIRKDIILQVGSLVFAILYGTFLNLWNSKGFFYRGLDVKRGTFFSISFCYRGSHDVFAVLYSNK